MLTVVTWNINSIQARLAYVLDFIKSYDPDFLCLQELKCQEEKFPYLEFEKLDRYCAVYGQKAYNGVAIISKQKPIDVQKSFNDRMSDSQARFILCTYDKFALANGYIPNGQDVGSEKFTYKLEWLKRAKHFLASCFKIHPNIAFVGDFNIAPDDRDVYDPVACRGHLHCSTPEREALMDVMSLGFIDAYRSVYPQKKEFSWWDYRELSFQRNKGLRIDLILVSGSLQTSLVDVKIVKDERHKERPSDHVPVIATFNKIP